MGNWEMTIQEIPVVGTRPEGQGAKGGLKVQEAQEARDVVDGNKEEEWMYVRALVTTELPRNELSNCIRSNGHRIQSWPIAEA